MRSDAYKNWTPNIIAEFDEISAYHEGWFAHARKMTARLRQAAEELQKRGLHDDAQAVMQMSIHLTLDTTDPAEETRLFKLKREGDRAARRMRDEAEGPVHVRDDDNAGGDNDDDV